MAYIEMDFASGGGSGEGMKPVTSTSRKKLTVNQEYTATKEGYLFLASAGASASIYLESPSSNVVIAISSNWTSNTYNTLYVREGLKYKLTNGDGYFMELN